MQNKNKGQKRESRRRVEKEVGRECQDGEEVKKEGREKESYEEEGVKKKEKKG